MSLLSSSYNSPSMPTRFANARTNLLALKQASAQPLTAETVGFEARYAERIKFSSQPVLASRDVLSWRDTFADRDVTEERDVYETRPVYEDRAVYGTRATGSKDISGAAAHTDLGLQNNSDFSIKVGDNAAATVKFAANSIVVTQGGTNTAFAYAAGATSFQSALKDALNSVAGVSASLDADGHLTLDVADQQSLTLAEVANGLFDSSTTALDKLGLVAGTTSSRQLGTEQVLTGTQEVKTGTQTVVVGTERVKTGREQYVSGKENYVARTDLVEDGTETYLAGYDRVTTTENTGANLTVRTKQVAARQDLVKLITEANKTLANSGAVGTSVLRNLTSIIEVLGAEGTLSQSNIDTAVQRLDQARGAYMLTAASTGSTAGGGSLALMI